MRLTRTARQLLAALVSLDLAVALVATGMIVSEPAQVAAASLSHAKVVVIVGPVGSLTDAYRAWGHAGADEARRWTDDVTEVFSPDATWPRVKAALQGASLVIYLGHGNGFPSPYGSQLRPSVQDGLGLNPVAGAGDDAHQYFGEGPIAASVHLAPGAVVLLHNLCYASGAGEPGMANPSLDVAQQRVDNFGAGWIAAGASAVVAEGHSEPAYYVRALLRDRLSPEAAWRASPSSHGNVIASASVRTPGAAVLLDPDQPTSGYYRSLVTKAGASAPAARGPGVGTSPVARGRPLARRCRRREPDHRPPGGLHGRVGRHARDHVRQEDRANPAEAARRGIPVDPHRRRRGDRAGGPPRRWRSVVVAAARECGVALAVAGECGARACCLREPCRRPGRACERGRRVRRISPAGRRQPPPSASPLQPTARPSASPRPAASPGSSPRPATPGSGAISPSPGATPIGHGGRSVACRRRAQRSATGRSRRPGGAEQPHRDQPHQGERSTPDRHDRASDGDRALPPADDPPRRRRRCLRRRHAGPRAGADRARHGAAVGDIRGA